MKMLVRITGQNVILPFYHTVGNETPLHIKHLYRIKNVKQFEKELDFFIENYKPVDVIELQKIIKEKKSRKRCFHISFDDGLKENYEVIAPVLLKKGIPATFFITTSLIDNKKLYYRHLASLLIERLLNINDLKHVCEVLGSSDYKYENVVKEILKVNHRGEHKLDDIAQIINFDKEVYLKEQKPYLTTDNIKALIKQGFQIGAHSHNHKDYSLLSLDEQLNETRESILFLEKYFNTTNRLFSFPYHDFLISKEFFNVVYQQEKPLLDMSFGSSGLKKDEIKNNFQRIPMEDRKNGINFVKWQYVKYLLRALWGSNMVKRG